MWNKIILVALAGMGLSFVEFKSGWLHEKHSVAHLKTIFHPFNIYKFN
jgi:cytochrome b subunit of formate dehydrogenase